MISYLILVVSRNAKEKKNKIFQPGNSMTWDSCGEGALESL